MFRPVDNIDNRMQFYAMQRQQVLMMGSELRNQEELQYMQAMEQQQMQAAAMGAPFMAGGDGMSLGMYDGQQGMMMMDGGMGMNGPPGMMGMDQQQQQYDQQQQRLQPNAAHAASPPTHGQSPQSLPPPQQQQQPSGSMLVPPVDNTINNTAAAAGSTTTTTTPATTTPTTTTTTVATPTPPTPVARALPAAPRSSALTPTQAAATAPTPATGTASGITTTTPAAATAADAAAGTGGLATTTASGSALLPLLPRIASILKKPTPKATTAAAATATDTTAIANSTATTTTTTTTDHQQQQQQQREMPSFLRPQSSFLNSAAPSAFDMYGGPTPQEQQPEAAAAAAVTNSSAPQSAYSMYGTNSTVGGGSAMGGFNSSANMYNNDYGTGTGTGPHHAESSASVGAGSCYDGLGGGMTAPSGGDVASNRSTRPTSSTGGSARPAASSGAIVTMPPAVTASLGRRPSSLTPSSYPAKSSAPTRNGNGNGPTTTTATPAMQRTGSTLSNSSYNSRATRQKNSELKRPNSGSANGQGQLPPIGGPTTTATARPTPPSGCRTGATPRSLPTLKANVSPATTASGTADGGGATLSKQNSMSSYNSRTTRQKNSKLKRTNSNTSAGRGVGR